MKKILLTLFSFFIFCIVPVFAGNIQYGFNAQGDYVPQSIGDQRVQYGFNSQGNYVPQSVGDQRIQYGFNAQGKYVPVSVGGY